MSETGLDGITLKKSVRRDGQWMTVAVLDSDYRHQDANGRLDLDRGQEVIPPLPRLFEGPLHIFRITVLGNQTSGVLHIVRLPKHKNQRLFLPGFEVKFGL